MTGIHIRESAFMPVLMCFGLLVTSTLSFAASQTLRLNEDSNSRIVVENAIVNGDQTVILFWTWPDLGNPNSGKPCPLNFYSVALQPGLPSATPTRLAENVCGSGLSGSGLLHNGDVKIIARDLLEHWRGGERISSERFASIEATRLLGVTSEQMGSQFYAFSPSGDVVIATTSAGRNVSAQPGVSLIVTALEPDNRKRWQLHFGESGKPVSMERVWAGSDGGALLYLQHAAAGSAAWALEPKLVTIGVNGNQSSFALIEMEASSDVQNIRPGSMEDLQKYFEQARDAKPESVRALSARPRVGGGFDVLFHREGGSGDRAGHFLYRFAADGSLQSEWPLGDSLEQHGLSEWADFYVEDGHLVVLSKVLASQRNVSSERKKWMQNVVSRIDLDTGVLVARLIPLDERYLAAAMNAGDEGQQYLEGLPGGDPVLLTSLGAVPLAVEIGYLKGRNTLRLNEATADLAVFTEDLDEHQAKLAKERTRLQKKTDREASKAKMNADMAAALGVSAEEYAALSNKERKQAMVRGGDMDAMVAAAMQQSEAVLQSMVASGAPPEQIAQIKAAMAQTQQMTQGGGKTPPVQHEKAATPPVLEVDALMRGHVQYTNRDGKHTTLVVYNRDTGEELLQKEYEDGVIDEYVNFGQYPLPLEKIGLLIRNTSGEILENLTPESSSPPADS